MLEAFGYMIQKTLRTYDGEVPFTDAKNKEISELEELTRKSVESALRINPKNIEALKIEASLYSHYPYPANTLVYAKILEIDPNNEWALWVRGRIHATEASLRYEDFYGRGSRGDTYLYDDIVGRKAIELYVQALRDLDRLAVKGFQDDNDYGNTLYPSSLLQLANLYEFLDTDLYLGYFPPVVVTLRSRACKYDSVRDSKICKSLDSD